MVDNMSKIPQIRFKGFIKNWEEKKLEDVISYIVDNRGKNPKYYCSEGIPVIDNILIKNNRYPKLQKATRFLDDNLFSNFIRKHNEMNDTLITLVGNGIGNITLFPKEKSVIIQNTLGFRFSNNKIFMFYSLLSKNKQIRHLDRGMAQPSIRQDELLDIDIESPPDIKEESKIGDYFYQLDNLIEQKEKKHQKLKQFKKAMLDKMFPKNGANTPEIRFDGFCGEWKEKEFNKTFTNIPNNTLSRAELNYNFGLAQNVHYGDVLIKFGELLDIKKEKVPFISNDDYVSKFKSSKLQNGDVIIADAAEDEIVGKCTEIINVEDEIIFSGLHTIPVRPIEAFASKYLGYYMNSTAYHNQLLPLLQGTKVLSISKSAIKNTIICSPKDSLEQTKIGNYFQKLDKQINLQNKEIKKLKNIKKASLDKMFV